MGEQIPVARADRVTVHCPIEGRYAFYNSPYLAHSLSTAIDIYPGVDFGGTVGSPLAGEVTTIRRVKAPKAKRFRDHGHDTVTLIKSQENPERLVKILHVEPIVQVGEQLELGQELGQLLRSGYFGFSTAPHIHLEVRDPRDPLRARGGLNLKRLQRLSNYPKLEEMRGKVIDSRPEYSEVEIHGISNMGLQCSVGETRGVIDGGIPYYGWLGAHTDVPPEKGASLKLCGEKIADIRETTGAGCIATCRDISFSFEGTPVGLSLFLYPGGKPSVFLIPIHSSGLHLERGSEISIEIS